MENRVLGLFKFGKRNHIENFVNNGHLYMNTMSYFRNIENDFVRSNRHENATYSLQASGAKLRVEHEGKWQDVGIINGPIISSTPDNTYINIFCMYAFQESTGKSLIDSRNFHFGDAYAVLTDGNEFLRRVRVYAKEQKIDLQDGLVEYVDKENYNGTLGVFRKFSKFAYQSEFRIAISNQVDAPFSINIGSLVDISQIGTLTEINEHIKFSDTGVLQIKRQDFHS